MKGCVSAQPFFVSSSIKFNQVSFVIFDGVSLPTKYLTAIRASIEASVAIADIYQNEVIPDFKSDGSPVTIADLTSSKILRNHLRETSLPIMGEEGEIPAYEVRKNWKEYWCIDPLDGTKMFLQRNGEFCVCVAHMKDHKPAFGIIADPLSQQVLCGGKELGVFQFSFDDFTNESNWRKIETPVFTKDIVIGSRSFRKSHEEKSAELIHKQAETLRFLRKGSALKFFDLANGRANYYIRFAPTMEWDIASGQAIVETLGGTVEDIETRNTLPYNKPDLHNKPFIISIGCQE